MCILLVPILSGCRDRGDVLPDQAPPAEESTMASDPGAPVEDGFPPDERSEEGARQTVREDANTVASDDEPSTDMVLDVADDEPSSRDLAAELNAAVGIPTDCTRDFERATATTIRVTISALVRPSGTVIQATASGNGLSPQARQCIARRTETVVLAPLDDGVPRRVSTVIDIDYVPTATSAVKSAKAGASDPTPRNVREPLPKRPEVAPSGRPIQEPTSRPIQDPTSRPIQEPSSRRIRGPQPRPIDGWEVDESSKDWR